MKKVISYVLCFLPSAAGPYFFIDDGNGDPSAYELVGVPLGCVRDFVLLAIVAAMAGAAMASFASKRNRLSLKMFLVSFLVFVVSTIGYFAISEGGSGVCWGSDSAFWWSLPCYVVSCFGFGFLTEAFLETKIFSKWLA